MAVRRGRTPGDRHRLGPEALRWRCEGSALGFRSTEELLDCPIRIIGQDRAQEALRLGLAVRADGYNLFVSGDVGSGRSTVVGRILGELQRGESRPRDLVYVHDFQDPDRPTLLAFAAGRGRAFQEAVAERIASLAEEIPKLFESDAYRRHRISTFEAAANEQKARLKEFEKRVGEQGFALVQVQMGPLTRPQLVPVVAGNAVDMDQLESLVEQGQFDKESYEQLQQALPELRGEMESLARRLRALDREVRRNLTGFDRELARPLVVETLGEIRGAFESEGLEGWLDQLAEDLLDHLGEFREEAPAAAAADGEAPSAGATPAGPVRYRVNVVVDNQKTRGRPIVKDTAPSYVNLFGTIERVRTAGGEWQTDHTRIKAGSLLRANGGFLVLDAMDVLVEPGVWAALKRTLRHRSLTIQGYDPLHVAPASIKPQPIPVDVKVVMIGTRQIYSLLYHLDEDFKKIFKVKAEFATRTPLNDDELRNYACLVYKKVKDDGLPHFQADAIGEIIEHGVRLAGRHGRLTTRFGEIADLIREAAFRARRGKAGIVTADHVRAALDARRERFNLVEELLHEQIAEGSVLLDLEGEKVGQVNGLAVLDLGDHAFGQPTRITATTAMGRAGILDLEREARMSGAIHTKGVLILTGFLRATFAQDKPLTLTASLCFEQNYGGIDGDSASSAELYALLSSLSGVPLRQSIAVTGSVNQRGEVQPIGGVNEKIEGFFDVCRLVGLTGEQGVMIPRRNLSQLMLRHDVVREVRRKRFHVWAVETIAEGLEVLTGTAAGERGAEGTFPEDSLFGRADAKLRWLAEQVREHGPADRAAGS